MEPFKGKHCFVIRPAIGDRNVPSSFTGNRLLSPSFTLKVPVQSFVCYATKFPVRDKKNGGLGSAVFSCFGELIEMAVISRRFLIVRLFEA